MVERRIRDKVGPRVRRDDTRRNSESQPIVCRWTVVNYGNLLGVRGEAKQKSEEPESLARALSGHVIGFGRSGWRYVIVVAAVFVVRPDQKCVLPGGAAHDGVDYLTCERLAILDVLWISVRTTYQNPDQDGT